MALVRLSVALCLASASWLVSGQMSSSPVCDAVIGAMFEDVGQKQGISGHYYLSRSKLNKFDADWACKQIGGFLVEFDSKKKFDIVSNCMRDRAINFEPIIIGGTVDPQTGNMVSSSASPPGPLFTEWHNGQLGNLQGKECASLLRRPGNPGVKMAGAECKTDLGRILCEI